MVKECSMKEIMEMNTAYIELFVEDIQKTAYVLSDKLGVQNFKIIEENGIRIYETGVSPQIITKALLANGVNIESISKKAETLEEFFLKMTAEKL